MTQFHDPRELDTDRLIGRVLTVARETLDMDVAFVADTRTGLRDCRAVSGEGEMFGIRTDAPVPLEGTLAELVLSGSIPNFRRDVADLEEPARGIATRNGIGAYVGVPIVTDEGVYGALCVFSRSPRPALGQREVAFVGMLARVVADQIDREAQQHEARRRAVRDGLVAALHARDGYTQQHSQEVVDLALSVGARLELSDEELRDLESVAALHDLGKLGIADDVLRKPGPLDAEEWAEMRKHPVIGARLVAAMPALAHLAPAVRAEHERWDGGGYPDGLRGEEIPVTSRIVLVCDAYHAMTSDRPYRPAMSTDTALRELAAGSGTQFWPAAVAAALAALGETEGAWEMFDDSDTATVVVDDERRYLYANDAAAAMYGVPVEDLLTATVGRFTGEVLAPALESGWVALKSSTEVEGFNVIGTPNGPRPVRYWTVRNAAPGAHLVHVHDMAPEAEGAAGAAAPVRFVRAGGPSMEQVPEPGPMLAAVPSEEAEAEPPSPTEGATVSVGEAAQALGVSVATLRRWGAAGRLRELRTAGGHRRFAVEDIRRLQGSRRRRAVRSLDPPNRPLTAMSLVSGHSAGTLVQRATARMYDGTLAGWFASDEGLAASAAWMTAIASGAADGRYDTVRSLSSGLMRQAELAGATLSERHLFLERMNVVVVQLLRDHDVSAADTDAVRQLFVALRYQLLVSVDN